MAGHWVLKLVDEMDKTKAGKKEKLTGTKLVNL